MTFSEPLPLNSGFVLPSRVMLSPMEGVMTPAFVRAVNLLKLTDLWLTPFISVTASVPSAPVLRKRLEPYTESGLPLIVQLIGRTPGSLAECAVSLERLGIRAINLNLACPSPTVTSHGAGGTLLHTPENVRRIVSEVRTALQNSTSLSVKLRAGFDEPDIAGLLDAVSGAEFIIFHYRTVLENYRPIKNGLTRLAEAVRRSPVPVFGNGDITSPTDATRMLEKTGCSGIALARSFLKAPGLLNQIRQNDASALSVSDLLNAMIRADSPIGPLREFARRALPPDEFRHFLHQQRTGSQSGQEICRNV